jgi:hypothetical protein
MSPSHTHCFENPRLARPRESRRICTLVVDAEEDFDWAAPQRGTSYSTVCMRQTATLHQILGAWGIVPTYLLTYPILQDQDVVALLRGQVERGQCEVGLQLHPWITPPFAEDLRRENSFLGNLARNVEEQKLLTLKARFGEAFAMPPLVFRAGRYGISGETPGLVEKHGLAVDTSIAPRTNFQDEGGPNYRTVDYRPFWFGRDRDLLELPLCRSIVGWAGPLASRAYEVAESAMLAGSRATSLVTRARFAERITLSPEGNDIRAMRRLVNRLVARGDQVLSLSFHSSSLHAGRNPYVRSKAELHRFYDALSSAIAYLVDDMSFSFAPIAAIPGMLAPPGEALPRP